MLMRMEPLWWQYMQSKLPMTLGRAFLAAFFADLRLPMDSPFPSARSPTNYAEQENRLSGQHLPVRGCTSNWRE